MNYRDSHARKTGELYDQNLSQDDFDYFMAKRESEIIAEYVKEYPPSHQSRYLDFACGSGRIISQVARHFGHAVGVDISSSMIETAKAKVPEADLIVTDLTRESRDLGRFDLITAFRFFGNAEDELRNDVLKILAKLSKRNGHLLINNHRNPRSPLYGSSGTRDNLDLDFAKFNNLLVSHGFEIKRSTPVGLWMFHHRLTRQKVWNNAVGRIVERACSRLPFSTVAPDSVILAVRV